MRIHVILLSEVVGLENCSVLIFTVEREVSSLQGYSKLLRRSARTSYKLFPIFGVVFFVIDLVMFYHFLFSFNSFLTLVHLTSTQSLRLQALGKIVPVPGFDQPPPLEY